MPKTPFSINLLKVHTEFKEILLFTSLLKDMTKDTNEQLDEEIHSVISERGSSSGVSILTELGYVTLPGCECIQPPRSSLNSVLGDFFWGGTSSFGHDKPSSPFSVLLPSQENGVGAKTFKPPSWLGLLLTSPHPEAMQKSTQTHLMRTKRHTYHLGNYTGFRSSVPGTGGRDQYRVYYPTEASWKWIPCVPKPDLLGQEETHIFITSALANKAEIRSHHHLHWCYSFKFRTLHTAQVPSLSTLGTIMPHRQHHKGGRHCIKSNRRCQRCVLEHEHSWQYSQMNSSYMKKNSPGGD